jgi:hypothetical protein
MPASVNGARLFLLPKLTVSAAEEEEGKDAEYSSKGDYYRQRRDQAAPCKFALAKAAIF